MWEGDFMGLRSFVLVLASLPAIAQAQTALPPDINPVTLSRLPPVTPEDLDEEGRKLLAARPEVKPGPGPDARHELQPQGAQPRDPIGRQQPGRPALLSARGADHGAERSTSSTNGPRTSPQACGKDSSSRSSTSSSTTRTSRASPTRTPRSSPSDARCIASTT